MCGTVLALAVHEAAQFDVCGSTKFTTAVDLHVLKCSKFKFSTAVPVDLQTCRSKFRSTFRYLVLTT